MTDGSGDWIERVRRDSVDRLEVIADMQRQLAAVSGEASAADGRVRVRVTPAGMPTQLVLSQDATGLRADELAGHIMAAIAEATVKASEQMRQVVGAVIPEEQLDAMMRGGVAESDVRDVREQIDLLRGTVG